MNAIARSQSPRDEMLGAVLGYDERPSRIGKAVGGALAAILHGYVVVRVAGALFGMMEWVNVAQGDLHEYFWATYEVDTTPRAKEEEKPTAEKKADEEEPVAPAPSELAKTLPAAVQRQPLTSKPPDAEAKPPPPDPYQDDQPGGGGGIQEMDAPNGDPENGGGSGNGGPGSGGGKGSGKGTGTGSGKGPGTGAPPVAAAPTVDKSAPAALVGSKSWNCPFPPEAEAAGKDSATVQLIVTVSASGAAESVKVISDPGTGFGRAARTCALGRKYKSGFDKGGNPTRTTTPPIVVRFSR